MFRYATRCLQALIALSAITGCLPLTAQDWKGEWTEIDVQESVGPLIRQRMVYDSDNDKTIMLGGHTSGAGEVWGTWTYDRDARTWTLVKEYDPTRPGDHPPFRALYALAYVPARDSGSGCVVLFGGSLTNGQTLNDTWVYHPDSNTWINRTPPEPPPKRAHVQMVYDSKNNKIVMYGGYDTDHDLGDTWVYDVDDNVWTEGHPADAPHRRHAHAMAFDPGPPSETGRVVMFGGHHHEYNQDIDETWTYDVQTDAWTLMEKPLDPAVEYPERRQQAGMTYDMASGLVVMFAGERFYQQDCEDTWTYDCWTNTWKQIQAEPHPMRRDRFAIAYDEVAKRTLIYGGYSTLIDECLGDMWMLRLVRSIEIDIKPGSCPNSINLGSNGVVPVAILSSADFDAIHVDPTTVELAGSGVAIRGKGKYLAHEEDVNNDGWVDLVVQVETENLNPDEFQDGYAILTGTTYDGQAIQGEDTITIVPDG